MLNSLMTHNSPSVSLRRWTLVFSCLVFLVKTPVKADVPPTRSIVFVVDTSGSMDDPPQKGTAGRRKIEIAKEVASSFVDHVSQDTELAIVTLSTCDTGNIVQEFTTDRFQVKQKIKGLTAGGSTPLSGAIVKGLGLAEERRRAGWIGRVVILGDGENECDLPDIPYAMRDFSYGNMAIDVIGFDIQSGSKAESDLQEIAHLGRGQYNQAADPAQLERLFVQLTTEGRMEQATTLLSTVLVISFAIERFISAIMFTFSFSSRWRRIFDVTTAENAESTSRIQRNRKAISFAFASVFGIVGVGWLANVGVLFQLGYKVPAIADTIFTGLLVAGGAEPIRELFQRQETKRAKSQEESGPQLVQLSGTVQMINIPLKAEEQKEEGN